MLSFEWHDTGSICHSCRIPQVQFSYQDPYKGFKKDKVKGPVAKLVKVKDISTATALEVAAGGKVRTSVHHVGTATFVE